MTRKSKPASQFPYLASDRGSFTTQPILVLEQSMRAVRGVCWSIARMCVVDTTVPNAEYGAGRRYDLFTDPGISHVPDLTTKHADFLRRRALEEGAAPEAIRLLHGVRPFSDKEIDDMTEKLSKKGAPAIKQSAAKPKGNPEALAKAREARAANGGAPDVRKLTFIDKKIANPYRDGSARASAFEVARASATVQAYKDSGSPSKYISRWEAEGLIKLS